MQYMTPTQKKYTDGLKIIGSFLLGYFLFSSISSISDRFNKKNLENRINKLPIERIFVRTESDLFRIFQNESLSRYAEFRYGDIREAFFDRVKTLNEGNLEYLNGDTLSIPNLDER